MKRTLFAMFVAGLAVNAHAQTPGQVPIFAQPGTGSCNSAGGNDCVNSAITQDASGNIGIGTTTPAATLDVAAGNLNLNFAGSFLLGGLAFMHSDPFSNTFLGFFAGSPAIANNNNTGLGTAALANITTGCCNTATGNNALWQNTSGAANTATGDGALYSNTIGSNNTATGRLALGSNSSGNNNTAIGVSADVITDGLNNATAIGAGAVVTASNKIRLGNTSVTVIEGQVAYTFTSDKHQKENFHAVDGDAVLQRIGGLNLTSWNYIGQDPQQFRHYGPVAQEFYAAFGHDDLGTIGTPTTINSGDLEGILMIAVQTLSKQNAELKARLEALERSTRDQ